MAIEHDVFISYAHVTNVPLPGVAQGWITNFVQGLKTRLAVDLDRFNARVISLWLADPLPKAKSTVVSPDWSVQSKLMSKVPPTAG